MVELLRCLEGWPNASSLLPKRTRKPLPARIAMPPLAIILPTSGDDQVSLDALAKLARLRNEMDSTGDCFQISCLIPASVQRTAQRLLDLAQLPGRPMAEHAINSRLLDQIIRAYRLDGGVHGPSNYAIVLLDTTMRHVGTIRSGDMLAHWRSSLRRQAQSAAPSLDQHVTSFPPGP